MTYVTRFRLNKTKRKKTRKVRTAHNRSRLKTSGSRQRPVFKLLAAIFVLGCLVLAVAGVFASSYLQDISKDLPTPDKPFGKKDTTSVIYDRNGQQLYRVFADEDRDPVKLSDVPPLVKWAFISAEDENFYEHPGVDPTAILRCGLQMFNGDQKVCGGSTITQQLIKKTTLTDEVTFDRKIKEMILALKIDQDRSKDEILQMYLTVIPEGSNIYGVTRAAQFYFGKKLNELNLAETAILAAIPQNPSILSPTKSLFPDKAQQRVKDRQLYVLSQMEKNMDRINKSVAEETGNPGPVLTEDMINHARVKELAYKPPVFGIEAPHFVFMVEKLLQQRDYNQGKPFTLEQIETDGLRIYTTLDLDMQKIAEEQVKKGVDIYGRRYGADNAALVAMNPKNGEILSFVGSKNYFGDQSPSGCRTGATCKFDPQVDVLDSYQAYGSTMKPFIYYDAMMNGMLVPDTTLQDIPIDINGYRPKNYEGKYLGNHSARWMLINSRNIPAIFLLNQLGVANFVSTLKNYGYSNFIDPNAYGPSFAVGGGDVNLLEHANAYAVLANGGNYTKYEVISRIEDVNGNILYEHKPETKQVMDPRGVYLVNNMLNGRNGGPGVSWDGRDIAGKTGTSESQKETMYLTYTPEIMVLGWLGNNDNEGMRYGASGFTSARPWVAEFVQRVGSKFAKTPFSRPPGVIIDKNGRLAISGIMAPTAYLVPDKYKLQNLATAKTKKVN